MRAESKIFFGFLGFFWIFVLSPFSFPTLFNFHHVKAQGMVPFTCSIFVSSAPCRLFLSDFDVTPSSLYTCYYLLKEDNWISFLRVNKVLLYCTVFPGRSSRTCWWWASASSSCSRPFSPWPTCRLLSTRKTASGPTVSPPSTPPSSCPASSCPSEYHSGPSGYFLSKWVYVWPRIFLPKCVSSSPNDWLLPRWVYFCQVSVFLFKWVYVRPCIFLPKWVSSSQDEWLPAEVSIFLPKWVSSCSSECLPPGLKCRRIFPPLWL